MQQGQQDLQCTSPSDQQNLYAYVGNDPVNASDPTGEFVFAIPAVYYGAILTVAAVGTIACVVTNCLEPAATKIYNSVDAAPPYEVGESEVTINPAENPNQGEGRGDVSPPPHDPEEDERKRRQEENDRETRESKKIEQEQITGEHTEVPEPLPDAPMR